MHSISRRGFVLSAAAASAALGLDKPLELIAPAFAQSPDPALAEKGFVKFKVGNIEVTQLYDGMWEKPHDPNFIKNASVEETKEALKAGGWADAYVPISITVSVVNIGGRIVLFDSGTGAQFGPAPTSGLIVKKDLFKAAGIDQAAIRTIVITHFHPDHIFGLMAKDTNAQVYPNAEILVPAAEYKFWTDPGLLSKLPEAQQGLAKRIQATFPTWKNITQFEGDKEITPGVTAIASNGHTPGHTSYLVSSGGSQVMVLGDVTNNPALFLKNPGWHPVFDRDPVLAENNRRKMLDRVVADKLTCTGYHWGFPGAGTIQKDGAGYALVPVKT
jgi:glyoxylase-like metal-dependent hydrolase (beta-lactamase superfamily II)